jgi:hypothetical protein
MKKLLLTAAVIIMSACIGFAQKQNHWTESSGMNSNLVLSSQKTVSQFKVFQLNLEHFKKELLSAPDRENMRGSSDLIINFPNATGNLERFVITEASVLHPNLAAKYPEIKSYAGQGIDDPSATIRFSLSQAGFHGMILSGTKPTCFIDPYTSDKREYKVYSRENLDSRDEEFKCFTDQQVNPLDKRNSNSAVLKTNDMKLRRYRLALSCNAEYGNLFAGSTGTDAEKKGRILAQMNVTMTRVNGIYERDLAITMQIVANNTAVIYYGSTTSDPWGTEYNTKTQQVIDAAIGNANYDIGHNFNTSGGGNAGCIGCVCTTGSKGSGYTGRADPTGDAFDIDYVAHEMGHQFGGYHVMNTCSRSGSGSTEVEPASGSSIMGYAGICPTNIQPNSDDYFAYVNIRDISANVQSGVSSGCGTIVNLTNNPPTANAGPDYVIPKSTPFVLKGAGTDPDGDALTYTWEQNDPAQAAGTGSPQSTWTAGPLFRSRKGTTSPDRYMPQLSDVIANNLAPTWEVVPSVGRTMNFSLTVRDNKAGGGQTNDDLMVVTVNGTAGPFLVSAPNTAVTWAVGSSQTVTWSVASTNVAPVSCANVKISLSTDGGLTYPVTLIGSTPNDGSEAVTVPNNLSSTCRVKIEAVGNIFYDISNVNFTISGGVTCTATTPTGLAASNVASTSATLSWTAVSGATYDVQYRPVGGTTWTTVAASSNSLGVTGLAAATQYEAQVRSKCSTTTSAYSASANFTTTTTQITYCASNGNSTADEYISKVVFGTISNTTTASAGGYGNFTAMSANVTTGLSYTITITPFWTSTKYNEGYAVNIDYNKDGDFADTGETVWTKAASQTTPVSGSFTIPSTALAGSTRMRVSMQYNTIPASCGSFNYGEVEDYTVNISAATVDTQAPSAPGGLTASGVTSTSANLSWTASTDNVGVTGYDVFVNGTFNGSTSSLSYSVTGLTASTTYSLSVKAKDAAGNLSAASAVNVTTTGVTCSNVTLTLKFDNYPEETSWTIKNSAGTTVASGGPYGSQADGSTINVTNCLANACYTFTINDSYGDGICCSYGSGSYSLKNAAGTVLASGSSFASSQATNFCLGTAKGGEVEVVNIGTKRELQMYVYPNPVKDYLTLDMSGDNVKSVRILTIDGSETSLKVTDNGVDVSGLKAGLYIISVQTEKLNVVRKFIKE